MSESHTPEPWLFSPDGAAVFSGSRDNPVATAAAPTALQRSADARRIAACVNALAGVPTADLEAGLVAELVGVVEAFVWGVSLEAGLRHDRAWAGLLANARAVLARLKGGAA